LHRLLLLGFLVPGFRGPYPALESDTLPIFIFALSSSSRAVFCHVDKIICGILHTIIFLPFSVFVAILIQILVLYRLKGERIL
jgi:hypothetical protein